MIPLPKQRKLIFRYFYSSDTLYKVKQYFISNDRLYVKMFSLIRDENQYNFVKITVNFKSGGHFLIESYILKLN